MKAFALACMFLIGMISFTGFGNTTTDPAENSETVVAFEVATVSVAISVSILETSTEAFEIEASPVLDKSKTMRFKPFLSQANRTITINPFDDSGGRLSIFYSQAVNGKKSNQGVFRNPRDAISCNQA